jgi:predicted nucleotidyltransferase component of viral defense system
MIASRCFEPDWIEEWRKRLGAADPGILEKAIHALALLCGLVRSKCDLVFKGGTALLLHLPEFRRLSIDIDIVCAEPKQEFERRLASILPASPFHRWDEHVRGDQGLPRRRHYKLRS